MRILILGGGEVGSTVAKTLATAGHSVTVMDTNEATIQSLSDVLDIQTMVGNAASPVVLAQSGAADADFRQRGEGPAGRLRKAGTGGADREQ